MRALRNSATLGPRDVSGSPAMASGMDSSATGFGVIGASLEWWDLHTEGHETHQADRDQSVSVQLCHEGNRRDHVTGVVLPPP